MIDVELTRSVRRRLVLSYAAVFGITLLLFGVFVHLSLAQRYSDDLRSHLHALVEDAEEHLETHPADPQATLRERLGPGEGLEFADLDGRRSVAAGTVAIPPAPWGTDGRATVTRAGGLLFTETVTLQEETLVGRIRATVSGERLGMGMQRLDLGLGLGLVLALAASVLGARFLAQQAIVQIESMLQRMREFTGDAAHELRGPLAAILGNAEALVRSGQPLAPEVNRRISDIRGGAWQLSRTLDDLLLLARIDEGADTVADRFDLPSCVAQVVASFEVRAREKGIRLDVRASNISDQMYGDQGQVMRILGNLVDNAIRYTPAGGTIEVATGRDGSAAVIRVTDTGIGIDRAATGRVFERFWRAEPGRGGSEGAGLGLAIARALARRNGGDITVSSSPGQGSTFRVLLPVRPARLG